MKFKMFITWYQYNICNNHVELSCRWDYQQTIYMSIYESPTVIHRLSISCIETNHLM